MRPSRRDSAILEALEGAAGVLGVGLRQDLELLAIRLGDLRRRLPEYRRLIALAEEVAAVCEDDRARAHQLLAEVLATLQAERSGGSQTVTEGVVWRDATETLG